LNKTFIWGHRGSGFTGVQNTISSFQNAIDMGVDGIKTEARLTKDNEIVLCFHQSLKKEGKDVLISKLEVKDIKQCKLENGETIPTLREVFETFKQYDIKYNFDIIDPKAGIKIIETAKEFNLIDHIEIAKPSIYPHSLATIFSKIRELNKNVTLVNSVFLKSLVINKENLEFEDMRKLDVQVVNVYFNYADYDLFKKVKIEGFKFYIWGLLFGRSIKNFLSMQYHGEYIDAVFSNLPDRVLKMRAEIQNFN
jgi:glycerophosphoryl diester phosphodiesterase